MEVRVDRFLAEAGVGIDHPEYTELRREAVAKLAEAGEGKLTPAEWAKLEKQKDNYKHIGLEWESDKLLREAGRDEEYPAYSEAELRRKASREGCMPEFEGEELEFPASAFEGVHEEVRYLIRYLASVTRITPLERTMLELTLSGWGQEEIAESLVMSRRTYCRKWRGLRDKLQRRVDPEFWASLRSPTIYRPPNKCCIAGREECKNDTGHCPYGRTSTIGAGRWWRNAA